MTGGDTRKLHPNVKTQRRQQTPQLTYDMWLSMRQWPCIDNYKALQPTQCMRYGKTGATRVKDATAKHVLQSVAQPCDEDDTGRYRLMATAGGGDTRAVDIR
eukprot:11791815-Alexandrium_andersonii.AAC.1